MAASRRQRRAGQRHPLHAVGTGLENGPGRKGRRPDQGRVVDQGAVAGMEVLDGDRAIP